jgi:hypothetical protein
MRAVDDGRVAIAVVRYAFRAIREVFRAATSALLRDERRAKPRPARRRRAPPGPQTTNKTTRDCEAS